MSSRPGTRPTCHRLSRLGSSDPEPGRQTVRQNGGLVHPIAQGHVLVSLDGFKGNLSLPEICFFFFSRGLKQMEVVDCLLDGSAAGRRVLGAHILARQDREEARLCLEGHVHAR